MVLTRPSLVAPLERALLEGRSSVDGLVVPVKRVEFCGTVGLHVVLVSAQSAGSSYLNF